MNEERIARELEEFVNGSVYRHYKGETYFAYKAKHSDTGEIAIFYCPTKASIKEFYWHYPKDFFAIGEEYGGRRFTLYAIPDEQRKTELDRDAHHF